MRVDKLQSGSYLFCLVCRFILLSFKEPPVYGKIAFLSFEIYKVVMALRLGFPQRYFELLKRTVVPFECRKIPYFVLSSSLFVASICLSWGLYNDSAKKVSGSVALMIAPLNFLSNLMLLYGAFRIIEFSYSLESPKDHQKNSASSRNYLARMFSKMAATFLIVATAYHFRQEPWISVVTAGLISALELLLPATAKLVEIEETSNFQFWGFYKNNSLHERECGPHSSAGWMSTLC